MNRNGTGSARLRLRIWTVVSPERGSDLFDHLAEVNKLFGIIAWTPLVPSTSWVMRKSTATLVRAYASSRVSIFSFTRKSIVSKMQMRVA
jgi:hypothetical protein